VGITPSIFYLFLLSLNLSRFVNCLFSFLFYLFYCGFCCFFPCCFLFLFDLFLLKFFLCLIFIPGLVCINISLIISCIIFPFQTFSLSLLFLLVSPSLPLLLKLSVSRWKYGDRLLNFLFLYFLLGFLPSLFFICNPSSWLATPVEYDLVISSSILVHFFLLP
jgi:hypothetical protein